MTTTTTATSAMNKTVRIPIEIGWNQPGLGIPLRPALLRLELGPAPTTKNDGPDPKTKWAFQFQFFATEKQITVVKTRNEERIGYGSRAILYNASSPASHDVSSQPQQDWHFKELLPSFISIAIDAKHESDDNVMDLLVWVPKARLPYVKGRDRHQYALNVTFSAAVAAQIPANYRFRIFVLTRTLIGSASSKDSSGEKKKPKTKKPPQYKTSYTGVSDLCTITGAPDWLPIAESAPANAASSSVTLLALATAAANNILFDMPFEDLVKNKAQLPAVTLPPELLNGPNLFHEAFVTGSFKSSEPWSSSSLPSIFASLYHMSSVIAATNEHVFSPGCSLLLRLLDASSYLKGMVKYDRFGTPSMLSPRLDALDKEADALLGQLWLQFIWASEYVHHHLPPASQLNRSTHTFAVLKLFLLDHKDILLRVPLLVQNVSRIVGIYFNGSTKAMLHRKIAYQDYLEQQRKTVPWPHSSLAWETVYRAGFRYEPNILFHDRCICHSCGREMYGWKSWHDPRALHSRNCATIWSGATTGSTSCSAANNTNVQQQLMIS